MPRNLVTFGSHSAPSLTTHTSFSGHIPSWDINLGGTTTTGFAPGATGLGACRKALFTSKADRIQPSWAACRTAHRINVPLPAGPGDGSVVSEAMLPQITARARCAPVPPLRTHTIFPGTNSVPGGRSSREVGSTASVSFTNTSYSYWNAEIHSLGLALTS